MKIFYVLLLCVFPLFAQDTPETATTNQTTENQSVEMPKNFAKALLVISSGGLQKNYTETTGELFLNKTFVPRRMSDGTQRFFNYRTGILSNNTYTLRVEMRTDSRLHSMYRFNFFFNKNTEKVYLNSWEEVNYVGRQFLTYKSFNDLIKGVDFFKSLQPPVKRVSALVVDEILPQESVSNL